MLTAGCHVVNRRRAPQLSLGQLVPFPSQLQMSVSLMLATLMQRCRFRPLHPSTQLIPTACEWAPAAKACSARHMQLACMRLHAWDDAWQLPVGHWQDPGPGSTDCRPEVACSRLERPQRATRRVAAPQSLCAMRTAVYGNHNWIATVHSLADDITLNFDRTGGLKMDVAPR